MKKCLVLSENTYSPSTTIRSLFRNIGAMEVAKHFRNQDIDTTHIEWFSSWEHDKLLDIIQHWFKDSTQQYIAISVTFSLETVILIRPVLDAIRKQFPNVQIIVGGNRNHDSRLEEFIDYIFLGRSMEMLDAWINDEDMHRFASNNPKVLINHNVNFEHDVPVLPDILDTDLLTPTDILGFEIGIGCKFNCSFCSYPLRGVKDPLLAESERIRNFLQTAYDKYGVHNFYIADDTLNEQDEKLEVLANAVEKLTYKPNIVSYFRLDLINSRPQQLKLLKRCNLKGINLGIETLTPAAAKTIRKSGDTEKLVSALKDLQTYTPSSFISTGMIVGLTGDTEPNVFKNITFLKQSGLVHGISPYNLTIQSSRSGTYEDSHLSEFSKNPERFGYTLFGNQDEDYRKDQPNHINTYKWKNDWCTDEQALTITQELVSQLNNSNFPVVTAFEWIVLLTVGVAKDISEFRLASNGHVWSSVESKIQKHKTEYIKNKIELIKA